MGHHFRGHSDTEVLLHSVEEWGLRATLKRLVGMFAFGLWDRNERVLHLARDRLGEKPLYYGWQGNCLLFGSELKALTCHPDWTDKVDRDSLTLLLRHNYIPTPYSIYQGIYKLCPGSLLSISESTLMKRRDDKLGPCEWGAGGAETWWSASKEEDTALPRVQNPEEAVEDLEQLLTRSVSDQMVADVPVGALLSGGIDSSTIVAVAQAHSLRPVRTFTVGFGERDFDEASHARKIAGHLGTDHTELRVSGQQALEIIPEIPRIYDEPFADASQIPTCLVSRLARQQVTVALSGDGGDELFCGYSRYRWTSQLWRLIDSVPVSVRPVVARTLEFTGKIPSFWRRDGSSVSRTGHRMQRIAELLNCTDRRQLYCELISQWKSPATVVNDSNEPATVICDTNPGYQLAGKTFFDYMMYVDQATYLPDDILVKVDRASMSTGLEMRVPLLDHRIVEYARHLPLEFKLRGGRTKWVLRKLLSRYVPERLFERPKMGFGVPLESWLRGPLREWASELLEEGRLRREGFFDPLPIQQKWREHLAGHRDWQYYLWDILMFQAWLEQRHA
jgi:asparagine synthase (glutamine-hydrolysing)